MKAGALEQFASRILVMRGRRVMLNADLADVYGVTPQELNRAVKRNLERFPLDFAFQLNASETIRLRSQLAASNPQLVPRVHPWVFTDHGALMAAYVLHSEQAIQMSVHIVRASVHLREMVAADEELATLLDELERRVLYHDEQITSIVRAIRALATTQRARPGHPHPIPPPSRGRG